MRYRTILLPLILLLACYLNSSGQTFQYQPILYQPGDNLTTPYHAFLVFDHPITTGFEFFNARVTNGNNGEVAWLVKNLPIAPGATLRPLHYRLDMSTISDGPSSPEFIQIEAFFGSYQLMDTFTPQIVEDLVAQPVSHYVPSSSPRLIHNSIPFFPPIPPLPILPDTIEYLSRECNVPNIDLDAQTHPDPNSGDANACAPAAAANSLKWLMQEHPAEILDIDSLRGIIEQLKVFMGFDSTGVEWDTFIMGKLEYIDTYQLPIRVKYQVHTPYPGFKPIIESPDSTFGHAAENKTTPGGWPDYDWIINELEKGEDVEMGITYWCDSSGVLVQRTSHAVNLTGYFKFGNDRWLVWKHDINQDGPGGTCEEYGRWGVDEAGYPFLSEMSESDSGCIAYVGDVVSESYDSTVTFEDVTGYNWKYRPIEYLPGSAQEGYPFHAWLTFRLPFFLSETQFLNVIVCNPETGEGEWVLQNVPLPDDTDEIPVRIKMDLGGISVGGSLPDPIIIKYHIGAYQENDDFTFQSYATLMACPEIFVLPNGGTIGFHPLIPRFPPILAPITLPPPVEYIIRGCEVPNIDLDSMSQIDDWNACGPAAAANSLQWLDDQHEEIDIPVELRPILDSLKRMMMHHVDSGVHWMAMIEGKLEFIDQFHLPIRVKYQAHRSAPAEIASPNPVYSHKATNESPPDPNNPGMYLHPTFDWLCQELEEDEDVEMMFGYYCDTTLMPGDTFPDGSMAMMDTTFMKRKFGHVINVTGKVKVGPLKWITYKQDVHQAGEGGTTEDNTPDGARYTDMSEWIDVEGGYAYLKRENYIEMDGDTCRTFVESIVSESYDPDIEFCPDKVCIPDDDGAESLREALACVMPGDTIVLGADLAGDTIKLTSGPLVIGTDVVIIADPAHEIFIEGESVNRVFEVLFDRVVVFEGFNVICGESESAACVHNAGETTFRDIQFFSHDGGLTNASQIINTGTINIEGTTNLKK